MEHFVCQGETLDSIASHYGTTTDNLVKINSLKQKRVTAGSRLLVSTDQDEVDEFGFYYAKKYENWQSIATKFDRSEAKLKSLNPKIKSVSENDRIRVKFTYLQDLPFAKPFMRAYAQIYTAKAGESLGAIAKNFDVEVATILKSNNLSNDFAIFQGCKLIVSPIFYKKDKTATPPEFYPTVFEGFSFKELIFHTLSSGETFEQVAKRYQIEVERLLRLNFLTSQASTFKGLKLWVNGQILSDAATASDIFYTTQRNDTSHSIAKKFGLSRDQLLKINALPSNFEPYLGFEFRVRPAAKSGLRLKTIYRSKESLKSFASRYEIDYQQLIKLNGLKSAPKDGAFLYLTPKFKSQHTDLELHITKQGSNLHQLCQEKRADFENILSLNDLKTSTLRPGQWLFFPKLPSKPVPAEWVPKAVELTELRPNIGVVEGQRKMGAALHGFVGACDNNHPDDLGRVQARLVELGLLIDGIESVETLSERIGRQPITSEQIPITIEALKEFQRRYVKTAKFPVELPELSVGLVKPFDQTDFVLRQLDVYHLPSGSNISAFGQTLYHESRKELSSLRSNKLFPKLWDILEVALPGRLDTLSAYPLRYGVLGFKDLDLIILLARMKIAAPIEFKICFENAGIDVEVEKKGQQIKNVRPKFYDLTMQTGEFEIFGFEKLNVHALNGFVEAAAVPALAIEQISLAIAKVVLPALELKIDIKIGERIFKKQPLMELLSCQLGACAVVDLTAHCGLKSAALAFARAFEALAVEHKMTNILHLRSLETKEIISFLRNSALEQKVRKRADHLMKIDFLSHKKDMSFAFPQSLLS